jgi:hypothetical protein
LWLFGIFCGNLVYFFRFGMLYQDQSGNPGPDYFFLLSFFTFLFTRLKFFWKCQLGRNTCFAISRHLCRPAATQLSKEWYTQVGESSCPMTLEPKKRWLTSGFHPSVCRRSNDWKTGGRLWIRIMPSDKLFISFLIGCPGRAGERTRDLLIFVYFVITLCTAEPQTAPR